MASRDVSPWESRLNRDAIADLDASRRFVDDGKVPEFAPHDVDLEGLEAWRQLAKESLERDFASFVDAALIADHYGDPVSLFTDVLRARLNKQYKRVDLMNALGAGGTFDLTKLAKYAPKLLTHVISRKIVYAILQKPTILDVIEPMPSDHGGAFGGLFADATELHPSLQRRSIRRRAEPTTNYPIRETIKAKLRRECEMFASQFRIVLTKNNQITRPPFVRAKASYPPPFETLMGEIPALMCRLGDGPARQSDISQTSEVFVLGGFAGYQPVKFKAEGLRDSTGFPTQKIFPEEDADDPAWRNWVYNLPPFTPSHVLENRRLADHHALTRSVITGADVRRKGKTYPSIDNPKGEADILTIVGGCIPELLSPENPLVDPLYTYTILKAFDEPGTSRVLAGKEDLLDAPWNEREMNAGCVRVWLRLGDLAGFQPMSEFQLRQNSRYMAIMDLLQRNVMKFRLNVDAAKYHPETYPLAADLPKISLQPMVPYALALRKLGLSIEETVEGPINEPIDERKLIRMLYTVARKIGYWVNTEEEIDEIRDLFSRHDPPDVIPKDGPADPEDYQERFDSFRAGAQPTVRIRPPRGGMQEPFWTTPYLIVTDEFGDVLGYAGAVIPSRVWVRLRDDLLFVTEASPS